ncbi:hypothetical protein MMC29_002693 [Sticta canariensis]|nr:hypothetical protein [Sticta canariensis]
MGKTEDNEAGFAFTKLAGVNNYKKWAREMRNSLESAGLWEHALPNTVNKKPIPIELRFEDLENDAKLERQGKRLDKVNNPEFHRPIEIVYVRTKEMSADGLTKALPAPAFRDFCRMVGIRSHAPNT